MKNYLIDEHTFKKFVTKVKSSAAGDQITAVVKQSQNERTDPSVGKKLSTKKQKRSASADKATKKPAKKRKPKAKAKPTPPSSPIKPESEPESQEQDSGPDNQSNDSSPLSQIQSDQSDWDNGF